MPKAGRWNRARIVIVALGGAFALALAVLAWNSAMNARVDRLVERLKSPDFATRDAAEDELGRLTSEREIRRLVGHFGDDFGSDREGQNRFVVEVTTVFAVLGERGTGPVMEEVRASARRGRHTPWREAVDLAKDFLGKADRTGMSEEQQREIYARAALHGIGKAGAPALRERLATGSSAEKAAALQELAITGVGGAEDVRTAIALVNDPDVDVRNAAWTLLSYKAGECGPRSIKGVSEGDIKAMGKGLSGNAPQPNGNVMTLVAIDDPAAGDALAGGLENSDVRFRMMAAMGLALRGDKRAVEPILEAAKTRPEGVHIPLSVLAYIDDERAVDALVTALGDGDKDYRWQARAGLARLANGKDAGPVGKARARVALDGMLGAAAEEDRIEVLSAMAISGDERVIEPLKALLTSGDAKTRISAANMLATFDKGDSAAAFLAMLSDTDAGVRKAAVFALGRSADPRALPALRTALADRDSDVRTEVEKAIPRAKWFAAWAKGREGRK